MCDYEQGKCVCGNGTCLFDDEPEEDATFYDSSSSRNSSLPEDSPLSDYYVPTARELKDERRRFDLEDWKIVLITLVSAGLVALFLFFLYRRKHGSPEQYSSGAEDQTDAVGENSTNPNKDKMIASVVVDMRMNDPNLQDVLERASETDLSMTDTEGAGTIVSNLSSEAANLDIAPFEDVQEEPYIDPLASPSVVRRRTKHDVHLH